MKLSKKYNQVNLLVSLAVLLITGIVYYVVISLILRNKLDADLLIEEQEIFQYAKKFQELPLSSNYIDEEINYHKISSIEKRQRIFSDTDIFNVKEDETEPARKLTTFLAIKDQGYQVSIIRSKVESEDLLHIILLITLGITGVLLISSAFINRLILNKLWQPFYTLLRQLKDFNLSNAGTLLVEPTNISEFEELGHSASEMAQRVNHDYKELKSFTDNASHEMNTPIAVVLSKLDLLLQTNPINEEQGIILNDIYDALGKLSKLNQTLLLLTKIENNLMPDAQSIRLDQVLEAKIRQFEGLLEQKKVTVSASLVPKELVMSKFLMDILLNNLLSNAIKHNVSNGLLEISLTSSMLTIANSGQESEIPDFFFNRFSKSQSSDGLGLGLALIKQVCALYHFDFSYFYQNNKHFIKIGFGL
ncbi:signal transduction histidine kinase [Pedobacter sp. UYP30]|uniref:sensor histidine kinase n=1 Tax=Pedobacter sp. UYP30 TaxID=1756400 RepID=UPI003390BE04